MQNIVNMSPEIIELAKALAKAQGKVSAASKDSTNPHFKSRYADLASAWDACREVITANGLSIVQIPEAEGHIVSVTTMLMHTSGQWISGKLSMQAQQNTPQGIGSCITYARRYALMAFVGIAPDDDDGNAASAKSPYVANPNYVGAPEQKNILFNLLVKNGISTPDAQAKIHKTIMGKTMANIEGHVFEAIQALDEQGK